MFRRYSSAHEVYTVHTLSGCEFVFSTDEFGICDDDKVNFIATNNDDTEQFSIPYSNIDYIRVTKAVI